MVWYFCNVCGNHFPIQHNHSQNDVTLRPSPKESCPCNGERGRSWHRTRNLPNCEALAELRRIEELTRKNPQRKNFDPIPRKGVRPPWIPGTGIYVPEFEEP